MIKSFKSKALKEFFEIGKSSKVPQDLQKRIKIRLDRLEQAKDLSELKLPGFNFHSLKGFEPTRYTIHVNGPWCITFEFENGDASAVDLEQYH
ncbi:MULTISPECIES: type II toxin-antitoxin system RelE/ParE family toxin [Sinorhizobium]|uniref:Plasmid maintenance system killer n=1 Tax=Sinorhizobium americanum TaxID=194963 RepID=A0A2S3YKH6_9HYPH|nr:MULTISPECIES: type II toxin-antitoxin system RelE/ParE family toxin [Sinorhizobium]PDT32214.1 plasmid maintenance system killer [Sinorhizobium sp. FG01]POH28434.1 plasmid maintenance system killer [Sinorhizobium americanum]